MNTQIHSTTCMMITEKWALKYGAKITSKNRKALQGYIPTHKHEHKHTHTHTHTQTWTQTHTLLAALILPQRSPWQSPNIVTHCCSSHVMWKLLKINVLFPISFPATAFSRHLSSVALVSANSTTCSPPGSISAVTLDGSFLSFFSHRLALLVFIFCGIASFGSFCNESRWNKELHSYT